MSESATVCTSEVGQFGSHLYQGLDHCIRCQESKTAKANGKPTSGGIVAESMAEIKQSEISGQQQSESKKAVKSAATAAAKKAAELKSEEEIQKQRELMAEFIVDGKQEAQQWAARMFYGYDGDAFQLTQDETGTHCLAWAKVAKALNWQFDPTWMAIGALVFLESKTTLRQWRQMKAEMEAAAKRENAPEERVQ